MRNNYMFHAVLNLRTGQLYSEDFCIRVLDLTQMKKADHTPEECELLAWARVFKAETLDELEKLAEGREVFLKLAEVVKRLGNDEQVRRQCEAREMYEWSMQAQYHGGYRDGITKGEEKNRVESIKNVMEGLNYSEQQAMELLKIPEKEKEKYSSMLKNLNSVERTAECTGK